MPGPVQWRGKSLAHSLLAGRVSERELDDRVRAVLGLIKRAARSGIPQSAEERPLDCLEDRQLLRRAASESVVLLKRRHDRLPLDRIKPVAVIGPNARVAAYRGGRIAHLRPYYTVNPLEAIRQKSSADVYFEQGVYNHKERPLLGHQMRTASGKPGFDMHIYTEPPSVTDRQPVDHREFLNSCGYFFNYDHPDRVDGENWHVDITGTLTATQSGPFEFGVSVQGTARLFVDGALVVDNTANQTFGEGFFRAGTVEEVGVLVLAAGQTYGVLIHWAGAHTSELIRNSPLTFHPGGIRLGGCATMDTGAAIEAAAELARGCEQVVVLAGLMGDWENEGADRVDLELPPRSNELIEAVLAANPSSVICISAGSPVEMPWADKAENLMYVWYGGNETGNAIADVLYGDVNPSGKLPISLPVKLADNPAYLYSRAERRRLMYGEDVFVGYRYYDTMDRDVLFPFGHGLSYSKFSLSDLRLTVDGTDKNASIAVCCQVENESSCDGAETVQVYIKPSKPSVNRPMKELKGFRKIVVEARQKKQVLVPLDLRYALAFWDEAENCWVCEDGIYTVLVGVSSRGAFLQEEFRLEETFWWTGL